MLIRQYSICKDITNKSQEEEKVNTIKVYNSIIIMINISCSITTKYIIYIHVQSFIKCTISIILINLQNH